MKNLLRVNMTSGVISSQPLPEKYRMLGGRGLSSRVVLDEVPADCDPLGPMNKLVFAAGLLGGTYLSSANRLSVGGKSPLTGGIKESNAGGTTALRMAQMGYRAIIIEGQGKPGQLQYLLIGKNRLELRSAENLKGLGCFESARLLLQEWGAKAALALIGPAGEKLMNVAGIANTDQEGLPTRYSARGGLGAVMAAKGLKAIVILPEDRSQEPMDNPGLWKEASKKFHKLLQTTPLTSETMPKFGTALTMELINSLGAVPTRNFSTGQFEKADDIGGMRMREVILERGGEGTPTHACMPGCLVRCSNRYADKNGKLLNTPLEYETLGFLGANLGIGNLDTIARLNAICNDLGIDTIETGAAMAIAMEAGLAKFGDGAAAEDMLQQIKKCSAVGQVLGKGAVAAGKHWGVERVAAYKGQAPGAYDPRSLKVNGVTYATCPQGGDHTAGNGLFLKIDHLDPVGKVAISYNLQITSAWVDTLGLCTFVRGIHAADPELFPSLLNSRFGVNWTSKELEDLGKRVIASELEFNRLAGLGVTEAVPDFFKSEPLYPHNSVWDIPDQELNNIWYELGFPGSGA